MGLKPSYFKWSHFSNATCRLTRQKTKCSHITPEKISRQRNMIQTLESIKQVTYLAESARPLQQRRDTESDPSRRHVEGWTKAELLSPRRGLSADNRKRIKDNVRERLGSSAWCNKFHPHFLMHGQIEVEVV